MEQWNRQVGETDKAYEAFKVYLTMKGRSLQRVAKSLQKDPTLIRRWASKNKWTERAAAWDSTIMEAQRQEQLQRRQKSETRQEELANLLLEKATEILNTASTKRGTFYAATQMAELGCKLLRDLDSVSEGTETPRTILIRRADE